MKHILALFFAVVIHLLILSGCTGSGDAQQQVEDSASLPLTPLTVGMMSAVDAAPFYYALHEGYFMEEGVDVELILFTNAQHRQTALQTHSVDGSMTDLVALITHTAGDFGLTATLSTHGVFPLLSGVSLFEKDRLRSGTMEISVTNYILEEYLSQSHHIDKVFINEIPARLEAVLSGQLDVGIFPEPFASIGELRGLEKIIFPDIPRESLNLIAFTNDALETNEQEIKAFHRGYERAALILRAQPDLARDVLITVIPNNPLEARDLIIVPDYQEPGLPGDEFISEMIQWTSSVTGINYHVTPEDILDRRFIR